MNTFETKINPLQHGGKERAERRQQSVLCSRVHGISNPWSLPGRPYYGKSIGNI